MPQINMVINLNLLEVAEFHENLIYFSQIRHSTLDLSNCTCASNYMLQNSFKLHVFSLILLYFDEKFKQSHTLSTKITEISLQMLFSQAIYLLSFWIPRILLCDKSIGGGVVMLWLHCFLELRALIHKFYLFQHKIQ